MFTDNDLDSLKISMAKTTPFYFSAPYETVEALLGRLDAAEEIAKGVEAAHPNDENCGCSMCDLLKDWKAKCGK